VPAVRLDGSAARPPLRADEQLVDSFHACHV
jgi:hypothetical protein